MERTPFYRRPSLNRRSFIPSRDDRRLEQRGHQQQASTVPVGVSLAPVDAMSKNNNVNPGQYKVAGRERQGEDIDPHEEKAALKESGKPAGKGTHDKTKPQG
jgi:hypothetical protein